jgi:hypothetical protein
LIKLIDYVNLNSSTAGEKIGRLPRKEKSALWLGGREKNVSTDTARTPLAMALSNPRFA